MSQDFCGDDLIVPTQRAIKASIADDIVTIEQEAIDDDFHDDEQTIEIHKAHVPTLIRALQRLIGAADAG